MNEYAVCLLVFFLITFFIDTRHRLHVHRNVHTLLAFGVVWSLLVLIFDDIAISRGWWVFPSPGMYLGFIGIIPLEEFLFAMIVPYFFVVLWKYLQHKKI